MTGTVDVVNKIATYFGGPYDAATRTYHTIPAPLLAAGLAVVRRGFTKRQDYADFLAGLPFGTETGTMMVVYIDDDEDHRVALPAVAGRRKIAYSVGLHVFVWSKARYGEDVTDYVYTLGDAIRAYIRLDPTLGTGGIETGNFQVGEDVAGAGSIRLQRQQQETDDEGTKAYLLVSFEAHAYDVA